MLKLSRVPPMAAAAASMILGSVLVLGSVVLINRFFEDLERTRSAEESQIVFNRKQAEKQQVLQRPQAKPPPRRAPRVAPPPLSGLGLALSGIDFGLPGYDLSDLNSLEGGLLGDTDGLVMTDDTVDDPPRATFQAPMAYPPRAKARGVKGYVVLSLLIGVTGDIEQVSVIESFPEGVFEEAALQGVNQWKFEPAIYQGKAVRAWARQRIRFDLS
jgi:protein TonB